MTKVPDGRNRSGLLIYQTNDGNTRIEVRLENETVWLSQKLMAELFQVSIPTVNEHIRNLYEESELQPDPTIRKFRIVQTEGSRLNDASRVERHFLQAAKEVQKLAGRRKR